MALNDALFKQKIIDLQDEMIQATNYETAKEQYAEKLMQAVKEYITSGTVSTTVNTTGTAAAQTGTGTGTIS